MSPDDPVRPSEPPVVLKDCMEMVMEGFRKISDPDDWYM